MSDDERESSDESDEGGATATGPGRGAARKAADALDFPHRAVLVVLERPCGDTPPPMCARPTPGAELHATARNPLARWTSELAGRVARELATRGWRLEAVTTDKGSEFRSSEVQSTLARLDVEHRFIHAGRPQTNGCVERVQRTILDECWKPTFARYLLPKQTGLRRELERLLHDYNTDRAHNGRSTKGRVPDAVLGKAKTFSR